MKKVLLLIRKENSSFSNEMYIKAIEKFGGSPVLINDDISEDECLKVLKDVYAVLLPGGDDVGRLDYFLIKYALDNNLRLLGICQGMQSMAMFGSNDKLISIGNYLHKQPEGYVHSVVLKESKLRAIYGKGKIRVNSHHLQTVLKSYYFTVVGKSDDNLIEAIEGNGDFQIGVQWHPERMLDYDCDSKKLLEAFLQ